MFEFEWDPAKAASNLRKHRVSFDEAVTVFADNLLLSMQDDEHDFEQRWISLGRSSEEQLLVVVHTYRELDDNATTVRIISVRPATPRERRRYEQMP